MKIFFPIKGLHKGFVTEKQPPSTSFSMSNVRPYDTLSNRLRGGQRPGLAQWSTDQIGASEQPVVAMCTVASIE